MRIAVVPLARTAVAALLMWLSGLAAPAPPRRTVSGNFNEIILPKDSAPNDPGGRARQCRRHPQGRHDRDRDVARAPAQRQFLRRDQQHLPHRRRQHAVYVARRPGRKCRGVSIRWISRCRSPAGPEYSGATGSIKIRGVGNNISAAVASSSTNTAATSARRKKGKRQRQR